MKKIRTGGFKDWRNQGLEKSRTGEIQGLEESRSEGIWNWETKYFRNPGL
nr:hypothetical protein [uncultured Prevotella sp.]